MYEEVWKLMGKKYDVKSAGLENTREMASDG
jgi:hypothetical protein